MTINDHHMVMKKVRIADLKAKLSEHLRYVRRGHELVVMDRETPIAKLVPHSTVGALPLRAARSGAPAPRDIKFPPPLKTEIDPVDLLLQERQLER